MATILNEIVANRRTHHFEYGPAAPSTRSLADALRGTNRFIMECKAASPSKGVMREDYHPGDIARVYSRYAAAISVLCEPDYFRGSYAHLQTVALSTHLPVLCKDFITEESQVRAARYYGADAILLMLSVLDDREYNRLADVAHELNLDILTEVINEEEIKRAVRLGAPIIGINNRNLHDLTVDLTRTERLFPLIPADRIVVSESGIATHHDVRRSPANAFLVGSQLTSQTDIDRACRALVYGENKVCGLTTPDAAQAARAAGAIYGGLIFDPNSPRYVSRETAESIMASEPGLDWVAVTRTTIPELSGLHAVQLHDDAKAVPGITNWHVGTDVLDNGGGSGKTFDWSTIPKDLAPHVLLAGGLNNDNLTAALDVGTRGLDLNSGFETNGVKDPHKLAQAFHTIRNHKYV